MFQRPHITGTPGATFFGHTSLESEAIPPQSQAFYLPNFHQAVLDCYSLNADSSHVTEAQQKRMVVEAKEGDR